MTSSPLITDGILYLKELLAALRRGAEGFWARMGCNGGRNFTAEDERPRKSLRGGPSHSTFSAQLSAQDTVPVPAMEPSMFTGDINTHLSTKIPVRKRLPPRLSTSMPPKRKSAAAGASSAPKARQSKLAKEHNVSAQEEGEIKEAWSLFSEPMDGEKNGVLPSSDVKSALIALGIPPTDQAELQEFLSILDPEDDGYATYEPFFAICALKFHNRDDSAHEAELAEAFRLFTGGGEAGDEGPITLAHLRRVAAVLKEDVDEEVLKDMILEANGGAGVARGVRIDEFDGVMRAAGVWR